MKSGSDIMNIKLELLQNAIFNAISQKLSYMEIDAKILKENLQLRHPKEYETKIL